MIEDIFKRAVKSVSESVGCNRKQLLSSSRKFSDVEARDLLYYVCYSNLLKLKHIQKCMEDCNCETSLSTISRGVNKVESNRDLRSIAKSIKI